MPQVQRSALVSFSAEQMFNLVNDVASYPLFLPGCSGSKIHEQSPTKMIASVDVAKVGIKKTFVTENDLIYGKQILMQLIDGPFSHLKGGWNFTPLDEKACKVELNLEFEFSSKVVELAFGKIFNELTSNMVSSFTKRAQEVYVDDK